MSDCCSRTVKLVFGMQNEQNLKCTDKLRVRLEGVLIQFVKHEQKILNVAQFLRGFIILSSDSVSIGICGDRRNVAQQPVDLFVSDFFVLIYCFTD